MQFPFKAVLAAVLLTAIGAPLTAAEPWRVTEQPQLQKQLANARQLEPQNIAEGPKSVLPWGTWVVPNRDGRTYDIIQWYIKSYTRNTRSYIADLGTGEVKLREWTETEGKERPEWMPTVLHGDGNLYAAGPNYGAEILKIYRYDPDDNAFEVVKEIPHIAGEKYPIVLGPDGKLYGSGTWVEGDAFNRAAAYSFDPKTGDVHVYGPVGPSHEPHTAYGYSMGVDDTHIYVASGQIPWYLVAINIETGEEKVILEADAGGYKNRMWIHPQYPGAWVMVQKNDKAPQREYWLHHGRAIAKTNDTPPWDPKESPRDKYPPEPSVYDGQLYPNNAGQARIWYQFDGQPWRPVQLENVETYPLEIHRLVGLPNGNVFGVSPGYQGRFMLNTNTGKVRQFGLGGGSVYGITTHEGKVYWSGYPSGPVYVYDPTKPWTLEKPSPPNERVPEASSPQSNPYMPGTIYEYTRVKKVMSSAVGADGKVYFGGVGQRDYAGGGLGWYDPATDELGGMWEPFSGHRVYWLSPMQNGRRLIVSTKGNDDLPQTPPGTVFAYDVQSGNFAWQAVPVPGQDKAGPVVEVAPGRLMGMTHDPDNDNGSILYGLDASSGEVLFRKQVPGRIPFRWIQGTTQWDYQLGPDGRVWTYLDNSLVRINPADASVEVVGKLRQPGKMLFMGRDLYLAGGDYVRRFSNIPQ